MIVPYARRRRPWRWSVRRLGAVIAGAVLLGCLLACGIAAVSVVHAAGCSASTPPDAAVGASRLPATALAGHPIASAAAGADVVFVSLRGWRQGDRSGIEVLKRQAGGLRSTAFVGLPSAPAGLTLSPDGRVLLAAMDDGVAVLDVARSTAGDPGALLGVMPTGEGAGTVQLAVAGSHYVFAADEATGHVTVLDLPRMEAGDFGPAASVATIDVDMAPSGLAVSPDGRYVYVVSQVERPVVSAGPSDFLYGLATSIGLARGGTLSVIDVRLIELNATHSVVARVGAGCGPVRVAVSPDGKTAWVTARRSNELLAFRTDRLLAGRATGPEARVPVAAAPEGLRLVRDGRFALVAGSDRSVDPAAPQRVQIVDTAAALSGRTAVRTAVTVGGMPRDVDVTADQRTAYVANAGTSTLSTLDLAALLGS